MYPDRFGDGRLRTLRRRVREWRAVMAREFVHGCLDDAGRRGRERTCRQPDAVRRS